MLTSKNNININVTAYKTSRQIRNFNTLDRCFPRDWKGFIGNNFSPQHAFSLAYVGRVSLNSVGAAVWIVALFHTVYLCIVVI